jgi:hypothetical protein
MHILATLLASISKTFITSISHAPAFAAKESAAAARMHDDQKRTLRPVPLFGQR